MTSIRKLHKDTIKHCENYCKNDKDYNKCLNECLANS